LPVVVGGAVAILGFALVVRGERPGPTSEPEEVAQHG
jgi:hypothetical protein